MGVRRTKPQEALPLLLRRSNRRPTWNTVRRRHDAVADISLLRPVWPLLADVVVSAERVDVRDGGVRVGGGIAVLLPRAR